MTSLVSLRSHYPTHSYRHASLPLAGTLDFNLVAMPEPARNASGCSLTQLPEDGKKQPPLMNLFKKKRAKGWWPVFTEETGVRELAVSTAATTHMLSACKYKDNLKAGQKMQFDQHWMACMLAC